MNILESKRNKKIAAGTVAGVLLITLASCSVMNKSKYLVLANTSVEAELGQKVSTNVADYLDTDKVDNADKVIRDTRQTDNIKYVTVDNLDENGKVVSKEEKDYPEVGKYEIKFTYKKEKATVKVTVKDTTEPEIKAPETIDVVQYTDLSAFKFGDLLEATDYSDLKDWKIDTSKVDVNTVGTYDIKVSIADRYKNKSSKSLKLNIVQAPELAEGEVAVTEITTDANGNRKTVVTKKQSSATETANTAKPSSGNSSATTKPSNNQTSKPSSSNGSNSSDSSNNTGSSSSTASSKPGSTDSSSSKPTPEPAPHTHIAVGNSGRWVDSYDEVRSIYLSTMEYWGNKARNGEIDDATYDANCPYGYENVHSCTCGKITWDWLIRG